MWKVSLLSQGLFPFNSDEAIVGLMARHILEGSWPTFFYGQAYMGSLDATLVAAAFRALGQEVWVIRLVQVLLYLGTTATTMLLAHHLGGGGLATAAAGLLMAVPTVNVTLYTTVSLGGYGEALLIGNLLLLVALWSGEHPERLGPLALWGGLAGLGFWAFGLTLVYTIPSLFLLAIHQGRRIPRHQVAGRLGLLALGFVIGGFPWFRWAFLNGWDLLVQELFGAAIAGASPAAFWDSVLRHTLNFLLFGLTAIFGFRPPWTVAPLALSLAPIAFGFWVAVIWFTIRDLLRPKATGWSQRMLVAAVPLLVIAGFIVSPFGADPSGRYFMPLAAPLAIFAGLFLEQIARRAGVWAPATVLALVLVFNAWGTLQAAAQEPFGLTTQFDPVSWIDHGHDQALMEFLTENELTHGYSNYWVSYVLAFQSDERLIYVPFLPYHQDFRHTMRDSRYAPYEVEVAQSGRVAYITTNHPRLDERLRSGFADQGIMFREARIGDYQVFYDLSSTVEPSQLRLSPDHAP